MAVIALVLLLLGSIAGLLIGRWAAALPLVAAIAPAALMGGREAGALVALAAAGLLVGVQLHHAVADQYGSA